MGKHIIRILSLTVLASLIVGLFSVGPVVSAQPAVEWVARYNGPASGDDEVSEMVLGSSGNIYIAGHGAGSGTRDDYATIAYDSSGNELWVARYDGPGSGWDVPDDISVDSSENVYVTGRSWGGATYTDYATVAYDSSGNELWVSRYNGEASLHDLATGIALDSSGNVYVTGGSEGQSKEDDFATVKYDGNGNELWVARYDGPAGLRDRPGDIAVDSLGNVYVTGGSWGGSTGYDWATIAYDSSGNELWIARFNGPGNGDDGSGFVCVDPAGNIYVTGSSTGNGTDSDITTVKYDSSGNELWIATYESPMSGHDSPTGMVLDSKGNVYVVGRNYGMGVHSNFTTIAYDSFGNELWVKIYDGPGEYNDFPRDVAVDASGNVYVTGHSWGNGSLVDYATIAYDSSGNELWMERYDGGSYDHGHAVAVDALGNVYVTGSSWFEDTEEDIVTVKYASGQAPEPTMDIDPDTLNLKSKGRWITAYIELYDGRDVRDIDIGTILLNGAIPAERWPTAVGDQDEDGVPDLMVKFNRSRVQEYVEGLDIPPGEAGRFGYYVTLTVTGLFNDGTTLECSDTIRVLVVERMSVEPSPFLLKAYDGVNTRDPDPIQPEAPTRRATSPLPSWIFPSSIPCRDLLHRPRQL